MASVAERVAAGMAFLEERRPYAAGEINLNWLDIRDCFDCALGQLYGSFDMGREALGLSVLAADEMGFTCASTADASDAAGDDEFAELTAEWRRVITARREPSEAVAARG